MARPFQGTINLDIRDSKPDWDAFLPDRAPEGAPNVLVVLYDDTGCAAWSPYGGRIEMPTMRPPGRQRAHLRAVAHDRAVLAHALRVPDGPQPPPERLRLDLRDLDRLPGLQLAHPALQRLDGDGPARRRLEHVLGRQEPQHPGRRVDDGLLEEGLAARPRLRPLLRLHRRRDEPVVSRPRRGQPLRRPAVRPRGRLPPVEGPGRQGARVHPRLQAVRARQALVPVVLPRRQPRPAPRAAGVHRQVQGQVRRRLRGLPRVGPAAHDRARDPARGHRAHADQPDDAGHLQRGRQHAPVGRAERRREAAVQPDGRGLRRLLRVHRPPGRPDRRLPRGVGPARQHADPLLRRQRRLRRGQPERVGQREQVLQRLARHDRGQPADDRQARRPGDLQPLPDRLGGRVLDALPDVQALLVPGRRLRSAGDPLAGGDPGAGRGPHPVPPLHRHRPDDPRLLRRRDAGRGRRLRADAAARRLDALLVRRRATRPRRRRRSTTRCSARAASGTRAGRRSPSTGPSRSTSASSTRTAGSSSTPTRTASEAHDLAEQHPEKLEELKALWLEEAKKYDVLPLNDLGIFEFRALEYEIAGARRAASTRTTRAPARCPRRRRPGRPTPRTRSSPRSSSPRTRRA